MFQDDVALVLLPRHLPAARHRDHPVGGHPAHAPDLVGRRSHQASGARGAQSGPTRPREGARSTNSTARMITPIACDRRLPRRPARGEPVEHHVQSSSITRLQRPHEQCDEHQKPRVDVLQRETRPEVRHALRMRAFKTGLHREEPLNDSKSCAPNQAANVTAPGARTLESRPSFQ